MRFSGFSKKGHEFFKQLAKRQDRDWFKAHKSDYETLWVEPMKALLEGLLPTIGKAYQGLPIKEPKIFRLQRDVRFAKDKSPYKTHIAAMIALDTGGGDEEGMGGAAAIYMHFGTEQFAGAGHWMMPGDDLDRYRKLVAEDATGVELAKRVKVLTGKGYAIGTFETLKKVPKGFDPDHPRAELLKHKGLGFDFPQPSAAVVSSAKLLPWLSAQVKQSATVIEWLERKLH
jgi:uncharacterized protein (TIGR02453 family)